MRAVLAIPVLLLSCTPTVAQAVAGGRTPGSVLVFPVHYSGDSGALFTIVSMTNTDTRPQTPTSFGGGTNVHFEYVNVIPDPANPFRPRGCSVFNRTEYLTPGDHLAVLTSCHNATVAGGQEGYLVVSAEDPSRFQVPWGHDRLVGSEVVIRATGAMFMVNAYPIGAVPLDGQPTDVDGDGRLDFDGVEYAMLPDVLYVDTFFAFSGAHLTLLNLTGAPTDINTLYFSVWNDNEFPLSTTVLFSCWFDQSLPAISTLFTEAFLLSTPHDPLEADTDCDGAGDMETGWAVIDSLDVSAPGGTPIASDGVVLGCVTAGGASIIEGGHQLWESFSRQANGTFFGRDAAPPVVIGPAPEPPDGSVFPTSSDR